ncbi:MAG: PepSY-like domain-containing protein [Tidjanibacter sp.]|nr:PepSY-like domain-containing protein [Tidjanibacter sp.]
MKRVITLIVATIVATVALWASEITLKQLPTKAQQFISEYFAKDQIRAIHQHHHRHGNTYRVLFTDGSKINFDAAGQWTKIKLRNDSLPVEIIPEYITTYVWDAYPGVMIMSIETEGQGQEVELSDGTELTFNPKGNVVKID